MKLCPSLFICALSFSPVALSQAVPADAQIVISHSAPDHPASPPPLSVLPAATMSASSTPAPDDDFDPFLDPVEGDTDKSTAWRAAVDVMRDTKHRKWGFLVYRVYYGDDVACSASWTF
jgi:hypothetical protein